MSITKAGLIAKVDEIIDGVDGVYEDFEILKAALHDIDPTEPDFIAKAVHLNVALKFGADYLLNQFRVLTNFFTPLLTEKGGGENG